MPNPNLSFTFTFIQPLGSHLLVGKTEDTVDSHLNNAARDLNLKARTNPMLKFFSPSSLISFHQSLGIGELHAVKEGIITNAISYVINLIRAVNYFDQAHYKSNLRTLNKRIATFPEQFTLMPCRMVKFLNGLQGILKEKKKTRKIIYNII